ncbi:MAG: hypothetical protein A3H06_02165 [Candidatus Colwellbacteria bacterium RIFCSPLOWO2_12_FULL_44_13]|uniref:Uncharacterized protein n=3 Tax=Candidatus Colwelliibacteriota TaxID=1817904 RepID=A0A1G1Z496_9BACT|nr:MAG: hypothetical protein A3F24_01835 [Candidatus Colwellbacteria bacterium RIFCSPHIGHO2_12_FULL_44_17]OGY59354.1 MAG: hypothetical protein A3I31_01810 [Candidatus Colwellbacteria bacterium RIFCSPLOWO2_02_FULL_44_20b]OGY61227.1 MAG: hypothetical protein A3H06_02165 [Candidatus Colwellbacteria bacterium RIFCSPLOWO2_12_FULL_44_13]
MGKRKIEQFLEFLIIGLGVNTVENLLVVQYTTKVEITWEIFSTSLWFAIPFAVISEIIVDHPEFWKIFSRKKKES